MAGQIYSKYTMDILGSEQTSSEGIVSGYTIRCQRDDVGTSDLPLTDSAPSLFFLPTTAQPITLVSTSASDIMTLRVTGIGADLNEMSENIALTGTTPVSTVNHFFRVFRVRVIAGNINVGSINVSYDGSLKFSIIPGRGASRLPTYTVPKNRRAFVTGLLGTCGKGQDGIVNFNYKTMGVNGFINPVSLSLFQSTVVDEFHPYVNFPEGTDFLITARSSAANTSVSAGLDILLISEEAL